MPCAQLVLGGRRRLGVIWPERPRNHLCDTRLGRSIPIRKYAWNGHQRNNVITMLHTCVRCTGPAAAVMTFDYGQAEVWIDDLTDAPDPGQGYVLCGACGDRMTPPLGWRLSDRRNTTRLFSPLEVGALGEVPEVAQFEVA